MLQLSSDDSQRASFGGQRRPPDLQPGSTKGSAHSRQKTADFNSHGKEAKESAANHKRRQMKKPKPFSQKIDKNIIEFQILPDKVKHEEMHNDSILSGISLSGDNFEQNIGQHFGKDVKGLYHLSQESDNIETLAQQERFRSAVVHDLEKPPLMTSKRSPSQSNSS